MIQEEKTLKFAVFITYVYKVFFQVWLNHFTQSYQPLIINSTACKQAVQQQKITHEFSIKAWNFINKHIYGVGI